MEGKCQIEGCEEPAEYPIYKLSSSITKEWLYVCKRHEDEIGDNNIRLQGYDPRTGEEL